MTKQLPFLENKEIETIFNDSPDIKLTVTPTRVTIKINKSEPDSVALISRAIEAANKLGEVDRSYRGSFRKEWDYIVMFSNNNKHKISLGI